MKSSRVTLQTIIFDGYAFAAKKEAVLKKQVLALKERQVFPKIAAILFTEDPASQLYTELKSQAAQRVGIDYQVFVFSILDDFELVLTKIKELNQDQSVTGIIIQKPSKRVWERVVTEGVEKESDGQNQLTKRKTNFRHWWQSLVSAIDEKKDVDGLHPNTLKAIKKGNWQKKGKVLPATCQAVLDILAEAEKLLGSVGHGSSKPAEPLVSAKSKVAVASKKIIIIGRSDILGLPLYYQLSNQNKNVELLGKKELQQRIEQKLYLKDADIIISATGKQQLISGKMVKNAVIMIDVGEPRPDLNFNSLAKKAVFLTPVPGGVGPMTIVSLLKNCLKLLKV
ncbi:MAG: bifunctional 5,10-methylenetetrahydrofolate dehydrogenase/5,10-methenyltetrahydrofolate cyclohydrolase [Candidatus Woesebacteria bacterium]|jgi:methylenetetrahydrofolate dehydrogenase (NADP+)/methenyltetrahydrofolate cyclohydrolase